MKIFTTKQQGLLDKNQDLMKPFTGIFHKILN